MNKINSEQHVETKEMAIQFESFVLQLYDCIYSNALRRRLNIHIRIDTSSFIHIKNYRLKFHSTWVTWIIGEYVCQTLFVLEKKRLVLLMETYPHGVLALLRLKRLKPVLTAFVCGLISHWCFLWVTVQ